MATTFLHLLADRDGVSTGLLSTRGGRCAGAAALSAVTGDVAGHCHG
ncbi:hypothetical protein [Pseudoduganella lutea]|nr:hypothetical protein [Pseudoduganella lutea]